ncbi:MAG: alpha/beta hydrolase, partial [Candidatus Heimdallarchaeota archaeon]|nr:alpha/beta hydrolase [Candidatus Heimdallarchaeota archaeon]
FGDKSKPIILFLHGFPEFWYSWRYQIDYFVQQGYYVIVPDQRGYNLSDKPKGKKHYKTDVLTQDIVELIKNYTDKPVNLVGHDWGGVIAWWVASHHPNIVNRLIILNSPHPSTFRYFLKTDQEQKNNSKYMVYFQLPFLPERKLKKENFKNLKRSLTKSAIPGTFTEDDLKQYSKSWEQKGCITSMLNWYRSMRATKMINKEVICPVLIIWGKEDKFLKVDMAEASLKYCNNGKAELVPEATHWVQHEKPEIVNTLIFQFLVNN